LDELSLRNLSKPRTLEYTGFYRSHPQNRQYYFKRCDYHEKKESLSILVIRENNAITAEKTLEQAIQAGKCDAQTILLTYRKRTQKETAVLLGLIIRF